MIMVTKFLRSCCGQVTVSRNSSKADRHPRLNRFLGHSRYWGDILETSTSVPPSGFSRVARAQQVPRNRCVPTLGTCPTPPNSRILAAGAGVWRDANGGQAMANCLRSLVVLSGRNNTVRRRSHENLFHCRVTLAVWAALIVALFATITALPAAAQIIAAPGQSVTVPPNTTI